MDKATIKNQKRVRRHNKVRAKVSGTLECPRLAVYKSNRCLSAQLIDDVNGTTLASAMTKKEAKKTLKDLAFKAGEDIAKSATDKKITQVVFDRGGFLYTGNVKSFADGARKGGLTF